MKLLHYILLLFAFVFSSCVSNKSTTRITLYLDDEFNKEEQKCYIWGFKWWISGNEFAIFDSARIKQNQKKVRLKVKCPIDMAYRLCFTKQGPINERITLLPKSKVKLFLKPSLNDINGYIAVSGKGAEPTCAERTFLTAIMDSLQYKIENTNNSDLQHLYQQQMVDSLITQIQTTPYPSLALNYYIMLRTVFSHNLKKDELKHLKVFLQKKFNHPSIQHLEKKGLPISYKGKIAANLIQQIHKSRNEVFKQKTSLGSHILLSLCNKDHKMVSIHDIDSEYILVDFWASWCKPCQKETPYLKEALARYKDRLSIYAVSIDRYPDAWRKAIARDKSEDFIHVIGSDRQGLPNAAVHGLGVKSIPTNFLLDKNRCIIAKNLRGERLIQVLDSIIKQ